MNNPDPADPRMRAAAAALGSARSIVVLTGAGASAESGVPTFRDAMTGLWAKYDPHELATPEAFARDPALVTRWYDWRRQMVLGCKPNAGHFALAALQRRAEAEQRSFTLLTQNVDRLHQRAGSTGVVELHGTILEWRCTRTGERITPPPEPMTEFPPKSAAGGLLRPCVVWFGEALPAEAIDAAQRAIAACDLFISIGTSAVVYPAAGFIDEARSRGAVTIEINRDPTPATGVVDIALTGLSGRILPALAALLGIAVPEVQNDNPPRQADRPT